jgi:hypothetical protein
MCMDESASHLMHVADPRVRLLYPGDPVDKHFDFASHVESHGAGGGGRGGGRGVWVGGDVDLSLEGPHSSIVEMGAGNALCLTRACIRLWILGSVFYSLCDML